MCTRNIGDHYWDSPCTHDCNGCIFWEESATEEHLIFAQKEEKLGEKLPKND